MFYVSSYLISVFSFLRTSIFSFPFSSLYVVYFHLLSKASLVAQRVKCLPAVREIKPRFDPWVRKIPWRRK